MNTGQTCKTCKWWGRHYANTCDKIEHDASAKGPQSFEIAVTVADDHNLSVRFVTGPEFGCNQWELRA